MPNRSTATAFGKAPPRIGRDHLVLADWPISTSTFQQRRDPAGEIVDHAEHHVRRADGSELKVTLEAPSRIGLPIAPDNDVVVALINLAKDTGFASDIVSFVPFQLLAFMGWPRNQHYAERLKQSLKRLKALTITYENAWYDRRSGEVQPIFVTGILAEANLVFRKGRRVANAPLESYVQWTNNFFKSLKEGNLAELDLDLYFSWRRPCCKSLHRHLNKVWHGGKKPKTYERDLKQLACGHLGMTDSKDLKRNFQVVVRDMEERNYLTTIDDSIRYRRVRPGVWRVRFELHPDHIHRAGERRRSDTHPTKTAGKTTDDAERRLVCLYHQHRFGRGDYLPENHEIKRAEKLLSCHAFDVASSVVPRVADRMRQQFPDGMHFGAALSYFESALKEEENRHHASRNQHGRDALRAAEQADVERQNQTRYERRASLLSAWKDLTDPQRRQYRASAIDSVTVPAVRRRLQRLHDLTTPSNEDLAAMAKDLGRSIGECS